MSIYKVTGQRAFRGHQPGSTFEASLERALEHRAVRRGNIEVIEHIQPDLQPGSYMLPRGWVTNSTEGGVTDG